MDKIPPTPLHLQRMVMPHNKVQDNSSSLNVSLLQELEKFGSTLNVLGKVPSDAALVKTKY